MGHVCLDAMLFEAEIIREIFDKHCEGGLLTLCVDEVYTKSGAVDSPGVHYVEKSLGIPPTAWHHEKLGKIEYLSASCEASVKASAMQVRAIFFFELLD